MRKRNSSIIIIMYKEYENVISSTPKPIHIIFALHRGTSFLYSWISMYLVKNLNFILTWTLYKCQYRYDVWNTILPMQFLKLGYGRRSYWKVYLLVSVGNPIGIPEVEELKFVYSIDRSKHNWQWYTKPSACVVISDPN